MFIGNPYSKYIGLKQHITRDDCALTADTTNRNKKMEFDFGQHNIP